MQGVLKRNLFPLLILIPLVAVLQYLILKPHLRYAFADVDWMFLLDFKQLSAQYHDPISHFMNAWNKWGVYTYQVYYIGLIDQFLGFNYKNFQIVTLIFKVIATLSIYPVIFLITKSRLAAFLTTLIYTVAYSSVGVMYTVVTSGLFIAIPLMNLFFAWYWYLITKGENKSWEILLGVILFVITLLLATERMYPLIPIIFLIELFWCYRKGYSKNVLFKTIKRLVLFLFLFLVGFIYKYSMLTPVSGNAGVTYQKLMLGNWQVLLSPIISLGGLFIPKDFWPIFGTPVTSNFTSYLEFLSGPIFIFVLLTIFLSFFISQRRLKFIRNVLIPTIILSLSVYFLSTHQLEIPDSARMHFDFGYIIPALIGSFTISIAFAIFREWVRNGKKDTLLISMVGGVIISFVFIVMTWIPADYVLVFFGVHRYLTIPAIGTSLLMACLMTVIFNKLQKIKALKSFAFLTFLLLIPIALFNVKVISDHMKYELDYAGTDAQGHIRMKEKLWSFLGNISKTEPSVFYFDESKDYDNGYFDETTVLAGFGYWFGYWMGYKESNIIDVRLAPVLLRSNLICPEPRSMCLSKVKSLVTTQDGEKGILYGDLFYKSKNFYAFRFVNKDIVDIRQEIVKEVGLD